MVNTAEIHALLVTPDPWLVMNFTDVSRELGIDAQRSGKTGGVPEELGRAKYEAVLVDFDTVPETLAILASVRESPANRNALVFAVATDIGHRQQALRQGATFIFERPLEAAEIRRVLYAAYDLMARERRLYFRCTAELPVLLTHANAGTELKCTTLNLSSNGMALSTSSPLQPGEVVQIVLFLQEGHAVRGSGTVVWDDKHGKTGISFQCSVPQDQNQLDTWLDTRFRNLLPSRPASP